MRRFLHVFMLLALLGLLAPAPASAQSFSAYDVIGAVNSLRKSRGLAAYEVDSGLMSYSQAHSEYQAQLGTSTHLHADGTMPSAYGITENIAAGSASSLTLDFVINQIWADSLHMNTMVGYDTGYAGAGIALSGGTVYVTLDVRPGSNAAAAPGSSGGNTEPAATQISLVPLITATPNATGAIVHVVGYGQSLWSIAIAYGVKIDDIRNLNGLIPGSTDIYAGQKLVIRQAGSVTPQAEGSQPPPAEENGTPGAATSLAPTSPPEASLQATTPGAADLTTNTPTSILTATPKPPRKPPVDLSGLASTKTLAIALIVVGVIGTGWVLASGFRKQE